MTSQRVKGVGEVSEFGSDYSMRIWLQPEKMAQLGISVSDVTSAIEKQNVQAPAGTIGQMPVAAQQEFQYSARVKGRLSDAKSFENIILTAQSDGAFIRLKDVARVEMGSKEYTYESLVNGHPSAGFAIKLTSDANALETISNVKQVLEEASKKFPAGMQYRITVDNSKFVRESITEVVKTFGEALLLVVLVVFIFLQSWRATLIPLLAIPVSLVGTFGAFGILGFTINTLTLFGMVLAIGLVVDDAIVVIEAVEHHMRYSGLSPREATYKAMEDVSGPIVAIAFVLASVFLPVAFFGGMMGVLYRQFALTIAVSMALSALVALSLTPALCALLLKPHDPDADLGKLGQLLSRFNRRVRKFTGAIRAWCGENCAESKIQLDSNAFAIVDGFWPFAIRAFFVCTGRRPRLLYHIRVAAGGDQPESDDYSAEKFHGDGAQAARRSRYHDAFRHGSFGRGRQTEFRRPFREPDFMGGSE